ncbi:mycofactocin radical SAM maturase [Streptomyces sp. L7]
MSLDGATADVNDSVRGRGSYDTAVRAMRNLADAGMKNFKLSVVCTRHNIPQMDEFKALADRYGAQLRLTRLRPSRRGADVWDELHPLPAQQRELYDWLLAHGDQVLTGDSFFHLSAYGEALPGLNLCGAGRVVCLIDPVGDVYACPFAIHEDFLAGNVRQDGGFTHVWRESELFRDLRETADRRGLRLLLLLQHVQGRLHGREVLHRTASGGTRSRVRPGIRRTAAGPAPRPGTTTCPGPPTTTRTAPRPPADAPPDRWTSSSPHGRTSNVPRSAPAKRTPLAGLKLAP